MKIKRDLKEAKLVHSADDKYGLQFELDDYNLKNGEPKKSTQQLVRGVDSLAIMQKYDKLEKEFNKKYKSKINNLTDISDEAASNAFSTHVDKSERSIVFTLQHIVHEIWLKELSPQVVSNMSYNSLATMCANNINIEPETIKDILENKCTELCDVIIDTCQTIATDYETIYNFRPDYMNARCNNYDTREKVFKLQPMDKEEQTEPTEDELLDNAEQAMKDYQAEKERKRKEAEEERRKANLSRNLFDMDEETTNESLTESLKSDWIWDWLK